jgi:hypothetical protein
MIMSSERGSRGPGTGSAQAPWRRSGRNAGTRPAVKNGWLPLSSGGGLREINSIGVISHDGQQLLIAAMPSGHPSESDVIQVVQGAAKAAVAVSAVACFQRPQARQYQENRIWE